jgi:hypothetical protein
LDFVSARIIAAYFVRGGSDGWEGSVRHSAGAGDLACVVSAGFSLYVCCYVEENIKCIFDMGTCFLVKDWGGRAVLVGARKLHEGWLVTEGGKIAVWDSVDHVGTNEADSFEQRDSAEKRLIGEVGETEWDSNSDVRSVLKEAICDALDSCRKRVDEDAMDSTYGERRRDEGRIRGEGNILVARIIEKEVAETEVPTGGGLGV